MQANNTDGANFGKNLKRIRKSLSLTQAEFAEKLGLSIRGYQRHEQSEASPNFSTIKKYAEMLGVEVSDLLHDPDVPIPNPQLELDERILNQIRQATQESVQDALKDLHLKQGREYVPSVRDKLEVILKDLPEHKLQSLLEYALKIKNPPKRQA